MIAKSAKSAKPAKPAKSAKSAKTTKPARDDLKTGYVFDPIFLRHTQPGHPESARRLEAIVTELETSSLLAELQPASTRAATVEELTRIHPLSMIEYVQDVSQAGGGQLDPDTYANAHTFSAASVAAGSLIDLTLTVVHGGLRNGFALVRPPGHHATHDRSMGFCVFSNVALAAKAALAQGGLERIAIVDFDVHHGNGTQAVCEDDPSILFLSTHQYPYYPGTGGLQETGRGEGEGTTINFPLPAGVGDTGFETLYTEVLVPALQRFVPQLILVSAGYDAHWQDPLAGLGLSLQGMARISKILVKLAEQMCEGKIVFTLEGGYDMEVLKQGVANSIRALLGRDDFTDSIGPCPYPEPDLAEFLAEVKRIHLG